MCLQEVWAYRFYGQGSYAEAMRFRLKRWGTLMLVYLVMLPNLLLCFLLGLYCGRLGVFETPHQYSRKTGWGASRMGMPSRCWASASPRLISILCRS